MRSLVHVSPFILSALTLLSCSGKSSAGASAPETTRTAVTNPSPPTPPVPLAEPVSNPTARVDNQTLETIAVTFHATVGSEALQCFEGSDALLQQNQIFTDIRLFLSQLAFVDDAGRDVPLALQTDPTAANMQYTDKDGNSIALLNFLDANCSALNATKKVNIAITGQIPSGTYKKIHFQIGLPYAPMDSRLAHIPAALAPSDMGWMWQHYPADLQLTAGVRTSDGSAPKVLNALISSHKKTVTLPLNFVLKADAKKSVDLTIDFGKIFQTNASDFLRELEGSCNNNTNALTEAAPTCAYAFKAFGLEVLNPKEPYEQSVFSIVP
ncbi:MAG: hypothetical protein H7249_14495 [Chitinophagaceae bacterium]|nr:hypothetical protein [Oligoflexus sp.]